MTQYMQTSWRRIFQRGVPSTGLYNQPAVTCFQGTWYISHFQALLSFFLFLSVCLLERSKFLTSDHRDRFSASFCWHRITPVCGSILIYRAENLVNNPHHRHKEDKLTVRELHKAKFSAEGDDGSACSL